MQQAVSARQDDSEAVGALGQAYSQRGDRARAVAQFEKALAMAPHSSSRDKWESLLKVNRYWLLIQQGDAALKANNLAQAGVSISRREQWITPTATRYWGWGCGDGAQR